MWVNYRGGRVRRDSGMVANIFIKLRTQNLNTNVSIQILMVSKPFELYVKSVQKAGLYTVTAQLLVV